jgi:RNA polymerase sigma factor (sigma-70 family)
LVTAVSIGCPFSDRTIQRKMSGNNRLVFGNYSGYDIHMSSQASSEAPRAFPNTRWSVVLAAQQVSPESAVALEAICRTYWYPLYAYVRRCGQSPHDAQDLTQEFFCQLLEKRWLASASREKGRLRTFLIVAIKNFMAKEWRRIAAQKRGGGVAHTPFDSAIAESRFAADTSSLAPDETYDQQWALTLLELTVQRLREEFIAVGRPNDFDALKSLLMAGRGAIDYTAVAKQLAINEGAARVAVHRLRKRFREIFREEISQTLSNGADMEAELRHLAGVLARH